MTLTFDIFIYSSCHVLNYCFAKLMWKHIKVKFSISNSWDFIAHQHGWHAYCKQADIDYIPAYNVIVYQSVLYKVPLVTCFMDTRVESMYMKLSVWTKGNVPLWILNFIPCSRNWSSWYVSLLLPFNSQPLNVAIEELVKYARGRKD